MTSDVLDHGSRSWFSPEQEFHLETDHSGTASLSDSIDQSLPHPQMSLLQDLPFDRDSGQSETMCLPSTGKQASSTSTMCCLRDCGGYLILTDLAITLNRHLNAEFTCWLGRS